MLSYVLTDLCRNKDIVLYNEQSKEMSQLISEYQKMKLRVEAAEKAQEDLDDRAKYIHLFDLYWDSSLMTLSYRF